MSMPMNAIEIRKVWDELYEEPRAAPVWEKPLVLVPTGDPSLDVSVTYGLRFDALPYVPARAHDHPGALRVETEFNTEAIGGDPLVEDVPDLWCTLEFPEQILPNVRLELPFVATGNSPATLAVLVHEQFQSMCRLTAHGLARLLYVGVEGSLMVPCPPYAELLERRQAVFNWLEDVAYHIMVGEYDKAAARPRPL